jgi:hypothetical protein|tara:strand:+ start:8959 stop:9351 length:393 start_codon:yes stop_codon:yes gene_type:complete
MADDQLKKDLKDILKIKGNVTRSRPVKGQIKKEYFCHFLENYKFANDRALILKTDFQVDFVHFEEPFVQAIEALLKLHFNKHQIQLIEWWLYEKWNQPDGSILELNNTDTEELIPSETAEDLWNLLKTLK